MVSPATRLLLDHQGQVIRLTSERRLHILERPEMHGPVNFVGPQAVTNEQFTHTLAGVLQRPAFFKLPAFAARLAPGNMGDEMLLSGSRIVPRKLLETGYTFRYPTLEAALRAELR